MMMMAKGMVKLSQQGMPKQLNLAPPRNNNNNHNNNNNNNNNKATQPGSPSRGSKCRLNAVNAHLEKSIFVYVNANILLLEW